MYLRALTVTALAATASQVHGQQLDAALRDTLSSDPQIAGAEALVEGAEAGVDLSRANRSPTLGLDARVGYQVNDTLYGLQRAQALSLGISLDIPLYTGGELTWRVRASQATLMAERARRDLTVNMRLASTAARYSDLYRDGRIEVARETQVTNVERLLEATRARERAGASTQTDTHQAVARMAMSKARLSDARAALTRSQESLREVTGTYFDRADTIDSPPLSDQSIADLPARIATFPAMKLASARIAMARADIRIAQSDRAPKLYLSSGLQTANDPAFRTALPAGFRTGLRLGLTFRMPLFQGGAPAARVRQAQQILTSRQDEQRATEMQLVAAIRAQFAQLKAAESMIPATVKALEANRAALIGVKAEIAVGTRSSLEVLNAQEEVTQSEVQLAQIRQQRLTLAYSILGMMGKLKPETPAAAAVGRPVAKPVAALRYDAMGLWVWHGSASWSLKAGGRVV